MKAIGSGDPRDLFAPGLFGLRASVVFAGMQTSPPDDDEIDRLELGPYERLIARIGDLDDVEPPPGWEDRAVARWRAARRKRRRLVRLGAVVVAAVLIALGRLLA